MVVVSVGVVVTVVVVVEGSSPVTAWGPQAAATNANPMMSGKLRRMRTSRSLLQSVCRRRVTPVQRASNRLVTICSGDTEPFPS